MPLSSMTGVNSHQSADTDIALFPIRYLDYPYHTATVFPTSVPLDEVTTAATITSISALSKRHGLFSPDYNMLKRLLVVDYRYSRFALDPRTGLFSMMRFVASTLRYPFSHLTIETGGIRPSLDYHPSSAAWKNQLGDNAILYSEIMKYMWKESQLCPCWWTRYGSVFPSTRNMLSRSLVPHPRSFILSIFSKSQVLFCGRLTIITTMRFASG